MKLIYVEWLDSHTVHGWNSLKELVESQKIDPCKTIGWLVKKTDESILVVSSLSSDENPDVKTCAEGNMVIPLSAIVKVRLLSVGKAAVKL